MMRSMFIHKKVHRLTAWIACCAMLLSVLAPSISHALAAGNQDGTGWVEICSTMGVKSVKVANAVAADSQLPAKGHSASEHCPSCFTHTEVLLLSPAISFVLPLNPDAPAFPPLFYQSPRPLFLWTKAPSRGPPILS